MVCKSISSWIQYSTNFDKGRFGIEKYLTNKLYKILTQQLANATLAVFISFVPHQKLSLYSINFSV